MPAKCVLRECLCVFMGICKYICVSKRVCIIICNVCLGNYDMYVCVYLYICVCGCTPVCMHMWRACMGTCVSVLCMCEFMCVRLHVATFQTRSCDLNSITGDSELCPLRTRYTGVSKIEP